MRQSEGRSADFCREAQRSASKAKAKGAGTLKTPCIQNPGCSSFMGLVEPQRPTLMKGCLEKIEALSEGAEQSPPRFQSS